MLLKCVSQCPGLRFENLDFLQAMDVSNTDRHVVNKLLYTCCVAFLPQEHFGLINNSTSHQLTDTHKCMLSTNGHARIHVLMRVHTGHTHTHTSRYQAVPGLILKCLILLERGHSWKRWWGGYIERAECKDECGFTRIRSFGNGVHATFM